MPLWHQIRQVVSPECKESNLSVCKYFSSEHLTLTVRTIWESERLVGSSFTFLKVLQFSLLQSSIFKIILWIQVCGLRSGRRCFLSLKEAVFRTEDQCWSDVELLQVLLALPQCPSVHTCHMAQHLVYATLAKWISGICSLASENKNHTWDTGFKGLHILFFKILSLRMYLLTGKFCICLLGGISLHAQNPQDWLFKKVLSSLLLTVRIVGVKMVVISCSAVGIWVPCRLQ